MSYSSRLNNEVIRCDWCGKFISCQDVYDGVADHTMKYPDSHFTSETYESKCKVCKEVDKEGGSCEL